MLTNIDYSTTVEQICIPLLQTNLLNIMPNVLYEEYVSKYCKILYKIDKARTFEYEVVYTVDNKIVSFYTLYDQTINQIDPYQLIPKVKPILDNRGQNINNSYTLIFDGSKRIVSNINFNSSLVTVFIVYKINSYKSTISKYGDNALFGNDDEDNNGKYITFNNRKSLIVAGSNSG